MTKHFCLIFLMFFSFGVAEGVLASDDPAHSMDIEYLNSTNDDRDIDTVNLDLNFYLFSMARSKLAIYLDIVAMYATGSITQLEGELQTGKLKNAKYDNSAFGFGPGLLADLRIYENKKLSIGLEASGNFLIHNKRFPAGGEYYNYLWRAGPSVGYRISKSTSVKMAYLRAHVSNGQGLGAQNPGYNAHGVALRVSGFF